MAKKVVMSTNEALAEAALRAGCRFFVGYPITPATEILEYMAEHMEDYGGVYLQPESEVAGMNMICGAGAGGTRCMTASSGEGFDLFQEGISAAAGWEIPCVVVNMCRSGPGRAGMGPSQANYFQVCKGGGHGDYHAIVLAPWNAQETVEITKRAFNLADKYRMVVIIFGDAILSHVSEPVEFDDTPEPPLPDKDWALTGCKGRQPRKISG